MTRVGKRKQPQYRIVVMDQRKARNSDYVEVVGTYNPRQQPAAINLKAERIQYWLAQGAQPSDTVRSFLRRQKLA
ncbi:MAG TPA: 30S ribosomal protein S16 [Candidatus Acidoferrales bacterium]|jgi:small subunit ribosomal protein S16|nr:30S ribosomal protein S16 [Candidatus Acidoferrales bacterium]